MFLKSVVLVSLFAIAFAKEQSIIDIPEVDNVIDVLSKQKWDEDEASCRVKIFNLLQNVKNSTLWATYAWNANPGVPTGVFFGARFHTGNYDQCLRPPWIKTHPELRTQYCLADVEMDLELKQKNWDLPGPYEVAEKYYVDGGTDFGRSFSYIAYGVCLPAGCPSKSAERVVRAILSTSHLRAARNANVSIHHCEEANTPHVYSRGYYVYMYTIAAFIFMAVASTYYISAYPVTAAPDTFVNHVAKSFCLRRNWATVFKEDKDALTSMHGIRFLTAVIIVIIHTVAFMQGTSVANSLDFEAMGYTFIEAFPLIHFDLYVDSFFAMAALLLGKGLATTDVSKPVIVVKNILKRYMRLFGPFAVTVLYLAYVSGHTDDGPMYPKIGKFEQQACEKNWWLALLMVGNYFNTLEMCHPATWYIPCDFHFYVITMVLLYVYRKNPTAGKRATAVVLILGFLGPAISAYIYDLNPIITYNLGSNIDIRKNKNFNYGYIRTHNRMGAYVVGLVVGYYMSIYKPANYKKIWSKTTSFLGAYAALNLMSAVLVLGVLCYYYRVEGFLTYVFLTFNRTLFAISVLAIIVFCTYGDVPLINAFLSWSAFAPLSRLSYGVYVIHLLFLYRGKTSLRSQLKHHKFDIILEGLGLVTMALIFSLAVWLFVEAPLINFTNRYLNTKSAAKEKAEDSKNDARNNLVTSQYDSDKQKAH